MQKQPRNMPQPNRGVKENKSFFFKKYEKIC